MVVAGWVVLLFGFALLWYENRFIVCDVLDRPAFFIGNNQSNLFLFRLLITYAALAVLWRFSGWKTALAAFVVYFIFGRITFRYYYKRELALKYAEWREALATGPSSDSTLPEDNPYGPKTDAELHESAMNLARDAILRNMRGGGR